MAFNFIDTVHSYFGNELIGKAENYLNEGTVSVKKGLEAIIPISLAGLVHKAETGHADQLLNHAREAYHSGLGDKLLDSFIPGGEGIPAKGPAYISSIFGDQFGKIANAVSSFAGLKGSSTSSLFGITLPFILALLGKHAEENDLSSSGLASSLSSEKSSFLAAVPESFNISSLLGVKENPEERYTRRIEEKRSSSGWVTPTLLALLAVIAVGWLLRSCNKEAPPMETPTPSTDTLITTQTDTVVISREPIKLKLPNGVELDAYKGGIEDLLIIFINDSLAASGKDNWFDFNELNFQFGTAEIIPESESELNNIIKILQAYPKVKIKIGGYTDKIGDEVANKKLSQDRADAIAAALKAAGVGSQVVGAEGYGSEFAKYPADAPEADRIKDRRVSVSVREK
ncbi:hypothetical protein C3K47_12090 [Solitalea longa]|uniref:OmpA-like domain-containing protein n=1 Tax=Solitalea longa TaxID=2079460 RepID=A0A2S5A077_9SPHI|nr:OmpA family protein [Solitalea longa]POY35944.1 hypothetical protein C3K47_12090 [Solitalea longa]